MTSLKTDSNQENQKKYYNYVIETYSGNIGAVKGVGYTGEVDKVSMAI